MNSNNSTRKKNNRPFCVSVIVPIFNGKQYIEKAVQSALIQPEVIEVILIDDGSTDGSFELAQQIATQEPKVTCLHHPDHQNIGLGATRNLGIKDAKAPFVAMLDVDDYFYPNRFKVTQEIFTKHPDADVVYEMIENVFTSEATKEAWIAQGNSLTLGIQRKVPPEEVFDLMVKNRDGDMGADGLTIKRSFFATSSYYPTVTKTIGEDTNLLLRMAAVGNLYAGSFEPVAGRLVHGENVSLAPDRQQIDKQVQNYEDALSWLYEHLKDHSKGKKLLLRVLIVNSYKYLDFDNERPRLNFWRKKRQLYNEYPEFRSFRSSILFIILILGLFPFIKKMLNTSG